MASRSSKSKASASTKGKQPVLTAPGSQGSKASNTINDIFRGPSKDKPSKKKKTNAAVKIQKYFRGWMVRAYYKLTKSKALKRSTNFKGFLTKYRQHCMEIMRRHGEENPKVYINFMEVNEYIDKVLKFEINFQMMLPKDQEGLKFRELRDYYTKCQLHPSSKEIDDAAHVIYTDPATFHEHIFTKREVVDVSLHIYVPKGTNMIVRKSTWLNPIIDGKEAFNMPTPKGLGKKTDVKKTLALVTEAKKERDKEQEELLEKLSDPKEDVFALLRAPPPAPTSRKAKSSTKLSRRK